MSIEERLRVKHPLPEWVFMTELNNGTGHSIDRRADAVAINCWKSKSYARIAYEVKRTRKDFLKELDQPDKRKWLEDSFNECWFAVSAGVVNSVDEIPKGWGLLVMSKKGDKITRKKAAQFKRSAKMDENLWLACLRNQAQAMDRTTATIKFEGSEFTEKQLEAIVNERIGFALERAHELQHKAAEELSTVQGERRTLLAPLQALADLTGDEKAKEAVSGPGWGIRKLPAGEVQVSSVQIRAWADKVVARRFEEAAKDLRIAGRAIARVLGKEPPAEERLRYDGRRQG